MNKKAYILTGTLALLILIGGGCSSNKSTSDDPLEIPIKEPVEDAIQEDLVTEPVEEPVIEPTTPEPTEEEPVVIIKEPVETTPPTVTEPEPEATVSIVNCGEDQSCLLKNIQSCTPATGDLQFLMAVFNVAITDAGSNCVIRHTAKSGMEGEFASWIGKHYDCSFVKTELAENPAIYDDRAINNITTYCTGPYVDLMKGFLNQDSSGSESSIETISVNVGVGREDGKVLTIKNIAGANGPITIQIDSESGIFNINNTETINGYNVTLLEVVPQTCTSDGVEKEGIECDTENPYMAKIEIQKL